MGADSLGASGAFPRVSVIVSLATLNVSCWFFAVSVLISFKIVDTLTDFVSDAGWKMKTAITTTTSVIRSQKRLVLSHFPLFDIGASLFYCNHGTLPRSLIFVLWFLCG